MHSLMYDLHTKADAKVTALDLMYDEIPSYSDYVEDVAEKYYPGAIKAFCETFPFCTQDAKDPCLLHIDHDAAKVALRKQLEEAYVLLGSILQSDADRSYDRYQVANLVNGYPYGEHMLLDSYEDMTDVEFMEYCASPQSPNELYVKHIWDYHS